MVPTTFLSFVIGRAFHSGRSGRDLIKVISASTFSALGLIGLLALYYWTHLAPPQGAPNRQGAIEHPLLSKWIFTTIFFWIISVAIWLVSMPDGQGGDDN
jgi:DMSO reductase anchor subunit